MALYQYEAIPHLETARVMSLAPGQPSDPLSGTLSTMSVVDPDPYEALSYAWGYKAPMDSTILCSGKALRITSSLAVALKRLRYTNRPRVIWVDQICINQKDLAERSRQVQHMNFIYQKASEVIVWLGDDDHGHAERAFSLVKSLVAVAEDPDRLELFKQRQLEGNLEWFAREDWIALAELLKTPWFDRKWVLQEIGTDVQSELLWGRSSVDWDHVSKAAALLKDYGFSLRRQYDLLVWKPWYMDKRFSPSTYEFDELNFAYELHRARWHLASDPRDHVFALLGHPAAQDGPHGTRLMEANYEQPVEEVFHGLAMRLLQKGDSLMILNTVQHESLEKVALRPALPTWVPQWDLQDSLHNLLGDDICVYRPSRDIRPEPKFLQNNQILQLRGLKIDVISTTTDMFNTSDMALGFPTVANVWKAQPECEGEAFTTASKYQTGAPALFAFLETLSAIKKRRKQAPISESQRLADGADFLIKSFGTSHIIGEDVRELSRSGRCQDWMERVSGGAKCRRFVRGQGGYYALCPPAARQGDELCLLFGGQTLFCLRPSGNGYLFVGECYVHGVMDGEALDMAERGELAEETFMIR